MSVKEKFRHTSKKKRKIIIIAAVLVVIAVYAVIDFAAGGPVSSVFKEEEKTSNTVRAAYGDISKVVEGSGTIEPKDEYQVTSMLQGDIIADYIEEGMHVEKDDILYEIDPDDINKNIKSAKENVSKAAISVNTAQDAVDDLTVTADFSGVITELNVKNGDEVSGNQSLVTIMDTENLVLKVPFNKTDAEKINVGDTADIVFATSTSTATGKVKSIASGTVTSSDGVPIVNVEISVKNPGAVVEGDIATASVKGYACNSYGTFSYGNSKTYTATASGTVTGCSYVEGDKIKAGNNVLTIDSDQVKNQLTEAQIAYNQTVRQLENYQETYDDDYCIKAKVAGEIVLKNSKEGDTLDATNGATVMAIIQDTTSLIFNMSIDELDISSVKVGQTVEVTADAVEGVVYKGTVTTKTTVGTSSNGVTTYPVEVTLTAEDIENVEKAAFGEENYERRLIPGMNVTGDIVVESKENVLRVPVSSIQRGNTVVAKIQGGSKRKDNKSEDKENKDNVRVANALDVPEGFEVVTVETGLADDDFIEIVSGLSEGDEVVVPEVESSAGIFGLMGGGMMGGGMPGGMSGGAPGGNRSGGGGGTPGGGMR